MAANRTKVIARARVSGDPGGDPDRPCTALLAMTLPVMSAAMPACRVAPLRQPEFHGVA
jgi:hypothetical protein